MRHRPGADRAGRLDHRERLLGPLGGDAQRIDLAPEHVALDQEADEAVVDLLAGVDLVVLGRRRPRSAWRRMAARSSRMAPPVFDVDGVHRPAVLGEAGHAVGGIEAAGEGEGEGRRDCIMHKYAGGRVPAQAGGTRERVQGQPMPAYAAVSGPECTPGSPPGGPRGTGPIL